MSELTEEAEAVYNVLDEHNNQLLSLGEEIVELQQKLQTAVEALEEIKRVSAEEVTRSQVANVVGPLAQQALSQIREDEEP